MPAKKKSKARRKPAKKSINISISDDLCKDLEKKSKTCCKPKVGGTACGGCAYFLGFIGAAVYYISTATGFWNGVWGFVKAIFWPAFLVHGVLSFIGI